VDQGRIAGLLYLAASVVFIIGMTLRAPILVSDPNTTIDNIRSSETLFRWSIALDITSATLFLLAAIALYSLLQAVDRTAALTLVVFAGLGMMLACVIVIDDYALLGIATRTPAAPAPDMIVTVLAELDRRGRLVTDLFSGLWLLPMGYLVMRSGFIPSAIGVLLLIGGIGWLAKLFIPLVVPEFRQIASLLPAVSISEVILIGWLLVRGGTSGG